MLIPTCEQCGAVWMDAALSDLVTASMVPVEGDETARDPADGDGSR
jgi:Zn-finger nucleic acid-binding protein